MVNKIGQMGRIIIAIVLALLVLVFALVAVTGNFGNVVSFLNPYSGTENVDIVVNSCRLACQDKNFTEFCEEERKIVIGDGRVVEGNCDSISNVGFSNFNGIRPCFNVDCKETEAECFMNKKKVECSSFSN